MVFSGPNRTKPIKRIRIMKRTTKMMLLVAVLWNGDVLEAEMHPSENLNSAKSAFMVNYHLPMGAIKEWRVM